MSIYAIKYPYYRNFPVLLMQWWLRAVGAKVGRNVCQLGLVGGIETDLKSIGNDVCLNFNAKPLSHSIEYHMLTFGECSIEDGATIGCRSIVEMDAIVPSGTHIPPMTPVHAVKVSNVSYKNLSLSQSDIKRSYSVTFDGVAGKDLDQETDLESGQVEKGMVVTNQVYYMD